MHTKVMGVDCYGELLDDSNFAVTCEDECEDGIWTDGNPRSESGTFESWDQVVTILSQFFDSKIVQIESC